MNAQLLTLAGLFLANLLLLAGLATVLDRRARARFLAELAVQRKRSADAETEALEAEHALVAGRVKGTVRALEVAYARREQLLRAEIEADALRARVTTTTEGKTLVVLESAQMVMGELPVTARDPVRVASTRCEQREHELEKCLDPWVGAQYPRTLRSASVRPCPAQQIAGFPKRLRY